MTDIAAIARQKPVQAALASFTSQLDEIIDLIIQVQQIPAPTFAEGQRAHFVAQQFATAGLVDVQEDDLHNVYGRFPGTNSHLPPVILSAHTDTVFPQETDLTIRQENGSIYGPGIGDNSTGVAGLITLAKSLWAHGLHPAADLWFVANVGEEGMGDLRGMRAVVQRFGSNGRYIVVEGGIFGFVCHQAIGVRRFRLDFQAPGGHSWGSFGRTSAIHVMSHLIAAIDQIKVPESPRTTYNVGVVQGGQSINSIAQSASLWLDLRSEDVIALQALETQVRQLAADLQVRFPEAAVTFTLVGDRPAGSIPRDALLVTWAEAALRQVGREKIEYFAGSTDTNIPLSQGIPGVCVGLARSANVHRLDEYLDPSDLPAGLGQLLLLTLAASGM
ncbi:MAG: M20/M25/M40 family metallo-hydrolase [Ardenticatenaceae bacterium]|nr:M20/M25/M40 family metallo-hydrolase [Anaerolineales bacterium]MCB8922140.1 M20/M25/M40 family metallo-hydrolase [Ardenticatenaceae bacterium]MCB8991120.1 M20/M25/M40 family metallo-hydrolase [Ardenticatenaceae bacterium]MCB9005276.1 M20/M25/M40 family metallo-hydrolase [Ardenticatenaceae bacterium]